VTGPQASSQTGGELLVTNALFLTMAPGEIAPFVGHMLVSDGRIAVITPGAPAPGTNAGATIDAKGKIVIPGFVSAHSHLHQSALRGLGPNQNTGEWRKDVHVYSLPATDEDLYWFTRHGAMSHLIHGVTSVFSFGYNARVGEYNISQLQAQLDSGMRFIHAYAQNRSIPADEQYRTFVRYHDFAKKHADDPAFLRVGITGEGATLEFARFDKQLMDEFGALNQAHFLSEAYRLTSDGRRLGKEEVQKHFWNFVDAGSLGPELYFGHFIHTSDEIVKRTAEAGAGMSWQPLSNGRLGSGIADIPKYLEHGLKVGMGVDGEASADIADPFENMRMGLYTIRAVYGRASVMEPIDVLRMATLGSAELMGVEDRVGSLELGKFADFLVIAPPSPIFDAAATIVFAVNNSNIDAVYVGGERLVDHAAFTEADAAKVTNEVDRRIARIRENPDAG
jgi:cytosine/adenosine deaminase-related metal-dependent hydrolase